MITLACTSCVVGPPVLYSGRSTGGLGVSSLNSGSSTWGSSFSMSGSMAQAAIKTILSNQEEKFCLAFAHSRNAIIAFSRAFPEYKDPRVHRVEGSKLLKRPDISARIDDLISSGHDPYEMTFEMHLGELRKIRDAAFGKGLYRVALEAELARGELMGFHNELIAQKKAPNNHLHLHPNGSNNENRGPATDDARATAVIELFAKQVNQDGA